MEKTVDRGTSGNRDSGGIRGREAGFKLKALPKSDGTSVGRHERFSIFQCKKGREDSFKISGLVVKDIALDGKKLDGQQLVVKYSLLVQKTTISPQALIDCRNSGFAFINEDITCQHNFPLFNVNIPGSLAVLDERAIQSGVIMRITRITCNIRNSLEDLPAFVCKLGH